MKTRYSGKSFKDSSTMKKSKLSPKEKRIILIDSTSLELQGPSTRYNILEANSSYYSRSSSVRAVEIKCKKKIKKNYEKNLKLNKKVALLKNNKLSQVSLLSLKELNMIHSE